MVIRVEEGKGRIDRYVMLSAKLLQILRDWWRVDRPQRWLKGGYVHNEGYHIALKTILEERGLPRKSRFRDNVDSALAIYQCWKDR
jgi:integrase